MQLNQRVEQQPTSANRRTLKFVDGYYSMAEEGYDGQMPVIVLIGRSVDEREKVVAEVEGFRPYLLVAEDELDTEMAENLDADRRVLHLTEDCRDSIKGQDLVKIVCEAPYHVPQLREVFETDHEADVRFIQRFLADMGITQYFSVPDVDNRRLTPDEVHPMDASNVDEDVPLRVLTVDIEVAEAPPDKPAVITEDGIERAGEPVTAITTHDSYTDHYDVSVLRNEAWDGTTLDILTDIDADVDYTVDFFDDEEDMLGGLVNQSLRFDVLTGWNVDGFDAPYLFNRCMEEEVFAVKHWADKPLNALERANGSGAWINSDIRSLHVFDLLDGYEKTQYTELKSSSLEDVAAKELDIEKLDVDEQAAYEDDPASFIEYNLRDVEAAVGIDQEVGII